MSKYLKLFETTSQYEAYISGSDVVFPNVSLAKDAPKKVYYNPIPPFFVKLFLNNGEVVELQGSGELTEAMISPYSSSLVSAEIGELCTSIGNYAFQQCSGLTSITIPDSVTSIGDYAFQRCSYLTSVTIGSGVTSIGYATFKGCKGLTSITIPSGVTSIGNEAFSSCTSLTNIVVDSANTVFDSRDNCNAIIKTSTNELIAGCKNTVIPDSVTTIGGEAFDGCTGLTNITIPDSVTNIGHFAFNWCTGLTSVTIGNGVTSIGRSVFSGCSGLTSVTIGSGVTSIGDYAFYGCTHLTNITSLATKAPTIQNNTFGNIKTGGTLTVPSGNTGYDVWMNQLDNWTKVEQ